MAEAAAHRELGLHEPERGDVRRRDADQPGSDAGKTAEGPRRVEHPEKTGQRGTHQGGPRPVAPQYQEPPEAQAQDGRGQERRQGRRLWNC